MGGQDHRGVGEEAEIVDRTLEESVKGDKMGGKAAGGRDTLEAATADVDKAGEGGLHGAEN